MKRVTCAILVVAGLAGLAAALGAAERHTLARRAAAARTIELSGIVEAVEVDLRTEVAGTVAETPVEEGTRVEAGALICRIDDEKLAAEAERADAAVREAEARLTLLRNGPRPEEIARARARVALEKAGLREAERVLRQARDLTAQNVAPKDEVERAEIARDAARARLEVARRELEVLLAGARAEEIAAAEAALVAAQRAAHLARLRLADCRIAAPLAATLTRRYVERGETVAAGALIATLADLARLRVKVYVTERDLGAVRLGQPVEVFVDAYPGRAFPGVISRLATEAEFTPRNLQTKEDRVKLVYEVRVDIPNEAGVLKPGMPADVRIPLAGAPEGGR